MYITADKRSLFRYYEAAVSPRESLVASQCPTSKKKRHHFFSLFSNFFSFSNNITFYITSENDKVENTFVSVFKFHFEFYSERTIIFQARNGLKGKSFRLTVLHSLSVMHKVCEPCQSL